MTVKIPISADVTGVSSGLGKLEAGARGVEKAVEGIDRASRKAAAGIAKIEDAAKRAESVAKRLASVQAVLSKETGSTVHTAAAQRFIENFDRMRADKFLSGGGKIRRAGSFEAWHANNEAMFVNQREAANYRRRIISMGLAGTGIGYAPTGPVAAPGGGGPGGSGLFGGPQLPSNRGGGGGGLANVGSAAGGMAFGFGKSMLAFAGITSVVAMGAKALDLATEESTTTDALKRSLGDLGIDFDNLRERVRATGEGLGITYVESVKLAQSYSREANARDAATVAGGVRTAGGFARAFGLDPGAVAAMMGQSRLMRGGGDDRRFAAMIAESISKGGTSAKADEVLQAVQGFATTAARLTLGAGDVGSYAGLLASMTRTGIPGLDVHGASGIINTADSALRRGGGMGEASLNFLYTALDRNTRGMNPIMAMAQMSGGLFGTSRSTFGKGTVLGNWAGQTGASMPGNLSDVTNMEAVKSLLDSQYGNHPDMQWAKLDAFKNIYSLNSPQQAAALYGMKPQQLGGLSAMLAKAGVNMQGVNFGGIQTLADISGAGSIDALRGIGGKIGKREDLTDAQRTAVLKATSESDIERMRVELTKVVASIDRERTIGSDTLEATKGITDTLTKVGEPLLIGVNAIKEAVVTMANIMSKNKPPSPEAIEKQKAEKLSMDALHDAKIKEFDARVASERKKFEGDPAALSTFDEVNALARKNLVNRQKFEDKRFQSVGAAHGIYDYSLGEKLGVADLVNQIRGVENPRGDPNAVSSQGASGTMQITRGTFDDYKKPGEVYENEQDRINAAIRKIDADNQFYKGNKKKVFAAYIGGRGGVLPDGSLRNSGPDANGMTPKTYADRVADIDPAGAANAASGGTHTISNEIGITVKNERGQHLAPPVQVRNSVPIPAGAH